MRPTYLVSCSKRSSFRLLHEVAPRRGSIERWTDATGHVNSTDPTETCLSSTVGALAHDTSPHTVVAGPELDRVKSTRQ
jgi:hypothetical protein